MKQIVVVAFDGAQLMDVAGPLDAFAAANQALTLLGAPEAYRVQVLSRAGGMVTTGVGLGVASDPLEAASRSTDTLMVVGGPGVFAAASDETLVGWIARQAPACRRTCSVCTGTFVLAAAGLLASKRVTTHWLYSDRLSAEHPDVIVEPDRIFIRDGDVWSSAGVTAGIDLALALVEEDLGRDIAMSAARLLVVFLKRPGGQAQFSAALALQSADPSRFGDLHDWMRRNLAADLRIERLAEQAGMTPRTFARLYVARTGQTPARTVELLRLEAARIALEDSAASIKQIARNTGFGDDERMRRAFLRQLGVSPADYRERFSGPRDSASAERGDDGAGGPRVRGAQDLDRVG